MRLLAPACVGVQAVIVHPALYIDTGNIRITFLPILAGTDWLVVDYPAEGMVTTGTWIFADFVDAGITFSLSGVGIDMHATRGFPVYPTGHLHTGLCSDTRHLSFLVHGFS